MKLFTVSRLHSWTRTPKHQLPRQTSLPGQDLSLITDSAAPPRNLKPTCTMLKSAPLHTLLAPVPSMQQVWPLPSRCSRHRRLTPSHKPTSLNPSSVHPPPSCPGGQDHQTTMASCWLPVLIPVPKVLPPTHQVHSSPTQSHLTCQYTHTHHLPRVAAHIQTLQSALPT